MKHLTFLLAIFLSAAVQAKPSPEAAREVIDYYFAGQDQGVLLVDLKLCDEIHKEGASKNECKGEKAPGELTQGEQNNIWMLFMVPTDVKAQEIMVQLNYQGVTMKVEKVNVSSSLRYRAWRQVRFDRAGEWTMKVLHDDGQNLQVLREMTVQVQAKAAE